MTTEYGVFITKEGVDVTQPQSINNFILHSGKNTLKIFKKVIGSVPVPNGGVGSANFVHGLRYIPAHLTYYRLKASGGTFWLDHTALNSSVGNNDGYSCESYVNSEKILFMGEDTEGAGASTLEYRSFILVDPIDLVPPNVQGFPLDPNDVGFFVSKPDIDVTKAKAHELLIASSMEALKFHKEIPFSFSMTGAQTFKEMIFDHDLPYIPLFIGVAVNPDTGLEEYMPLGRVPQPLAFSAGVTKKTITLAAVSIGFDLTITGRIIIFKNKLADA